MKEAGISASTKGLYVWNPGRHEFYTSAGNILAHEKAPSKEGKHWAGDFTYIKTGTGWLYHAVVVDLFSRRVVGWSFSRKRNSELTKSALRMALLRERPSPGCLFHSDQGIEYAAHDYRDVLNAAGMRRSMSRKGNPLDNAMVESFFQKSGTRTNWTISYSDPVNKLTSALEGSGYGDNSISKEVRDTHELLPR